MTKIKEIIYDLLSTANGEWLEEEYLQDVAKNISVDLRKQFIEEACYAYCKICDTQECGGTYECCWVEQFKNALEKGANND